MRATVVAIFLFMTALSSALGEILTPAIEDPKLIWAWAAPAIALAVQTVVFVWRHWGVNADAFMTYEEDYETLVPDGQKKEKVKDAETETEKETEKEKAKE